MEINARREQRIFSLQIIACIILCSSFDPNYPKFKLIFAYGASDCGLEGVLVPNGLERPIGYASYSLTTAEKNYVWPNRERRPHQVFSQHHFKNFIMIQQAMK